MPTLFGSGLQFKRIQACFWRFKVVQDCNLPGMKPRTGDKMGADFWALLAELQFFDEKNPVKPIAPEFVLGSQAPLDMLPYFRLNRFPSQRTFFV